MWSQFFLENAHFSLNLLAALVFFAICWLYYDVWSEKKTTKEGFRIFGFLALSLSFLIQSTFIESSILKTPFLGEGLNLIIASVLRIAGYILVIVSLILDPIQPRPKFKKGAVFILPAFLSLSYLPFLHPILCGIVGLLYLRRTTIGLERHIRAPAVGFYVLTLSEIVSLSYFFQKTTDIKIYNLVAPFGPIWIVGNIFLLLASIILGRWVFSYLLKRFQSQLFMIFTSVVLIIFMVITVSFTALLLNNLKNEVLGQVETDVKVLNYAVDGKKTELASDAEMIAGDGQVIAGMEETPSPLGDLAQSYLLTKKLNTVIIVDDYGQVLARGEDREKIGMSVSDDPLIKRALLDEVNSSIITKDGAISPQILVAGAAPIKKEGNVVGAVMVGLVLDNVFVDGLKGATGMESSIYGGETLSATTLTDVNATTRMVGIKETRKDILDKVLIKGENYSGSINLLNIPYIASYLPLKDVESNPVGMLFVAKPQIAVLQTAAHSIELTFLIAAILIGFSILPARMISLYIAKQIR
jgi:hypothetical protein